MNQSTKERVHPRATHYSRATDQEYVLTNGCWASVIQEGNVVESSHMTNHALKHNSNFVEY